MFLSTSDLTHEEILSALDGWLDDLADPAADEPAGERPKLLSCAEMAELVGHPLPRVSNAGNGIQCVCPAHDEPVVMCRNPRHPKPAIIGPHAHFNGGALVTCLAAESCEWPSCHPATLETDYDRIKYAWADEADAIRARYDGHEPTPGILVERPDITTDDLGPGAPGVSLGTCYGTCEPCAELASRRRPAEPTGPMHIEKLRAIVGWQS